MYGVRPSIVTEKTEPLLTTVVLMVVVSDPPALSLLHLTVKDSMMPFLALGSPHDAERERGDLMMLETEKFSGGEGTEREDSACTHIYLV